MLVALIIYFRIEWKKSIAIPAISELSVPLKLTVFNYFLAWAALYLVFYPLSFIFPVFVNSWLIELPPPLIYYDADGSYPSLVNLLSFLSLVVFAPLIEEVIFRGVLLHRWAEKWDLKSAVIMTSVLFGIGHTDPLGSFVFGVSMCIIYLQTQNLVIPIICHSLYNLTVWLIDLGFISLEGPDSIYTLETFQNEWYLGVIAGFVTCIWAFTYLKTRESQRVWRLPKI